MKTEELWVQTKQPYCVRVGRQMLGEIGGAVKTLDGIRNVLLVCDQTVQALYADTVQAALEQSGLIVERFSFPPGERHKNIQTLELLLSSLASHEFTKSDCLAALGGGVTGDLAGLAAALYLRGIRYIQLPTTLLAAVDSSVGGKTAVNFGGKKNILGSFHQPSLVLCDINCFATLPQEELQNGLAEIVKYAMICDEQLFTDLEGGCHRTQLQQVILRCIAHKQRIVQEDETEQGVRRILNFGHTIGHAIEACSGFALAHGRAVAAGMAAMCGIAAEQGICAPAVWERLSGLLKQMGLQADIPFAAEALYEAILSDKKRSGDTIQLVFTPQIGTARVVETTLTQLRSYLNEYGGLLP